MIKFDTTYTNLDDYLLVTISGQWTDYAAQDVIEEIKRQAESYGKAQVLLNLMNMAPPEGQMARFRAGEYIAKMWGALRVAAVWKQEFINKFAENVAVNRGASFAVFTDEKQALEWLLTDSPTILR